MGHARRDRGRVTPANALVVIKWNGSLVVGHSSITVAPSSKLRLDANAIIDC
jgi:hypothetical protein